MSSVQTVQTVVNPSALAAIDAALAAAGFDQAARARAVEALTATAPVGVGAIPIAAFRDELLLLYAPSMRARATRKAMEHCIKVLESVGALSTADFTVALVAKVVGSRPASHSPNTILGLLRHLSAAFSFAEFRGYIARSPFRLRGISSWVRPSAPRGKKFCSREEIKRVLDHMRHQAETRNGWAGWKARRLYTLTAVLAYTGGRANEIIYLRVADVDLAAGAIRIVSIPERRLKTRASETVLPVPPPLMPILEEWTRQRMARPPEMPVGDCPWMWPTLRPTARGPWVSGGIGTKPRERMKAVALEVGVAGFCPLALRHSFATHLLHWGAGAGTVKRLLRHSNERTQEHYLHTDLDNLRAAVANVDFDRA